jgi:hypothetical protein
MPATRHDSAKQRLNSSSANQLCAEDLDDLTFLPSIVLFVLPAGLPPLFKVETDSDPGVVMVVPV